MRVLTVQGALGQFRRSFVREAGILEVGALATLGVNFLLAIGLARVLGPQEYGVYALVGSTFTTISLLKRLGQEYIATTDMSAAYAVRDGRAIRSALASFNAVNVWSTIVVVPAALALAPIIVEWAYGDPRLAEPLRLALLPASWAMLLATVVLILQCSRRVVALAAVENANNLALAVCAFLGALVGRQVSDVFLGQAVASLTFAALALVLYQRLRASDALLPAVSELARAAIRPGKRIWSDLRAGLAVALDKNLVSLYPLAPILLLGALAPTDEVALLRVAMSYLTIPLLAFSAISRLLMVKLPALHATQPERVRPLFLQVTLTGGVLSILITLPAIVLAGWLIELLYGLPYAPAAALVPLLALDPFLAGFGIAAGPIFRTYHRNLWAVWANLAVLAIGLPLAYLLVQRLGLAGAALSYAALVTALRVVAYGLCLRILSAEKPPGHAT